MAIVYFVVRATLAPLERLNAGLAALAGTITMRGCRSGRRRSCSRCSPASTPWDCRCSGAERENRLLRARMVSIQDEERKEIGRELHDEIGPYLFAARAQAGAARRAAPGDGAALDAVIETIDALQSTNRRILDRLRPAALEELGLAAALQSLGRFFERNRANLQVSVETGELPALSPGLEAALYRIAQEALTNIVRHAEADAAQVTLACEGGALVLSVADDGRGFEPAQAGGQGLIGMRERVAAYGGALTLAPAQPHGLTLRAVFPLEGA